MKKYLLPLLLSISLGANEVLELDSLLKTYSSNSDLSKKTKLENSGAAFIYTRQDIEQMQARNLKDIIKTIPVGYNESRYGNPDPLFSSNSVLPFMSSGIRVYIDEQEITSPSYGSGISAMGDIDIGFVDHIEIYTLNPSFEYSTEPTQMLIKLYSKVAQRDRGSKVSMSVGSRGFNTVSAYNTDTLNDWSYFVFASHADVDRKVYESHDSALRRDREKANIFATLNNEDHKFQFQHLSDKRDTFINMSLDATPLDTRVEYEATRLGYEFNIVENIKFLAHYEHVELMSNFIDDQPYFIREQTAPLGTVNTTATSMNIASDEDVLTAELRYKLKTESNQLLIGSKFRQKSFDFNTVRLGGTVLLSELNPMLPDEAYELEVPRSGYNQQNIFNIYLEDQYNVNEQSIITFGVQGTKVKNNGPIDDENLFLARLGYTYTNEDWVYKVFAYQTEAGVEPYIYTSVFSESHDIDPQVQQAGTAEIKYTYDEHSLRGLFTYSEIDNLVMTKENLKVGNIDKVYRYTLIMLEHDYLFNRDNSLKTRFNATDVKTFDNKIYELYIRSLNRVGAFDIFNELNIYHNDIKTYYDYSAGVSYKVNDQLSLFMKGENIFDKGRSSYYERLTPITYEPQERLEIPAIDPRFYVTLEYLF